MRRSRCYRWRRQQQRQRGAAAGVHGNCGRRSPSRKAAARLRSSAPRSYPCGPFARALPACAHGARDQHLETARIGHRPEILFRAGTSKLDPSRAVPRRIESGDAIGGGHSDMVLIASCGNQPLKISTEAARLRGWSWGSNDDHRESR